MRKPLFALAIASILVSSEVASATMFEDIQLESFVEQSSLGVVGVVRSMDTTQRSGIMVREYTVAVSETVYGPAKSTIKVITPGGVIPNSRFNLVQVVDGSPNFHIGQEVMLVLRDMPNKVDYSVSGLSMGVLPVRRINGERYVSMNDGKGAVPISSAVQQLAEMRNGTK